MRSHTFPSAVMPDEGNGKPEAVKVAPPLFRATFVGSPTGYDCCIAIDSYLQLIDDRRVGLEFRIMKSCDILRFTNQGVSRTGERIVISQNPLKGLRIPLDPGSGHVILQLEQRLHIFVLTSLGC